MSRRTVWPTALAAVLAADILLAYTGPRDDSLCNTTRDALRTDTPVGSVALAVVLAALYIHIVARKPIPGADPIMRRIGVLR